MVTTLCVIITVVILLYVSIAPKVHTHFLIACGIVLNLICIGFIVDAMFAGNSYKSMVSNVKTLPLKNLKRVDQQNVFFAQGEINGTSLLTNSLGVESNSLVLVQKVFIRKLVTFNCPEHKQPTGMGNRTIKCSELRWQLQSSNYKYSSQANLKGIPLTNSLLKELAIATKLNRVKIGTLSKKRLLSFDSRTPVIQDNSIYFKESELGNIEGDLKVKFYSLTPKKISFLTSIKHERLTALDNNILDEKVNTYNRVYANGIVPLKHFVKTSTTDLIEYLKGGVYLFAIAIFLVIRRLMLGEEDVSKSSEGVNIPAAIAALVNALLLSLPIIYLMLFGD